MLSVVADKNSRAALAKFTPEQQADVIAVLRQLPAAFGRPHAHTGLGVRQLRRGIFEARVGLQIRVLFERDGDLLVIKTLGTHEDIRHYLRERA